MTERPPERRFGELILSTIVLLALAVGGIVVLARSDALWTLLLALAATAAGSVAAGLSVRAMVADRGQPRRWRTPRLTPG